MIDFTQTSTNLNRTQPGLLPLHCWNTILCTEHVFSKCCIDFTIVSMIVLTVIWGVNVMMNQLLTSLVLWGVIVVDSSPVNSINIILWWEWLSVYWVFRNNNRQDCTKNKRKDYSSIYKEWAHSISDTFRCYIILLPMVIFF